MPFGHCPSSAPASAPCAAAARRSRVALYVGAGDDVRPLERLVDVGRFVCADGLPRSEYGALLGPGFARPDFVPALHGALAAAGFGRADLGAARAEHGPLAFRDGLGRTVEYHLDTAVPEDAARLPARACDVLVVAGHNPHRAAVDRACAPSGLTFVGLEGTVYDYHPRDAEPQSVLHLLHTDPAFRARFVAFHYASADTPAIVRTWAEFLRAAA